MLCIVITSLILIPDPRTRDVMGGGLHRACAVKSMCLKIVFVGGAKKCTTDCQLRFGTNQEIGAMSGEDRYGVG